MHDKAAMHAFWSFYEPRATAISEAVSGVLSALHTAPPDEAIAPDQAADRERHERALQRLAILEDRWAPYLASLREQGVLAALSGHGYAAWYERIKAHRGALRAQLAGFLRDEPTRDEVAAASRISHGLDCLLDIMVETTSEAYFTTKDGLAAASDERYRSMFDKSPLPMWMYDRETLRFLAVNDAAVRHYGYSRDEFAKMTLTDIRPSEDAPALLDHVGRTAGSSDARLWRHRRRDGALITVEIRGNDFVMEGRNVRLVLVHDVTDREESREALRKTEDQLRHAQKMDAIGQLAGGVAHDFNNLLTVIESYACILLDALDATDPRHEDALQVKRAAERASMVTRQLLTVSRHNVVQPQPINLGDLVAGFMPLLKRLVGQGIAMVVQPAEVPPVIADPGQIEQVLMNLAVNARDAMGGRGRLTIETELLQLDDEGARLRALPPGDYVVLALTDTGTGMAPEVQARIFEPFFTTKEAGRGTGLGLSIVHGVIAQAGGAISLYSELGHGTTFRVHLPVAAQGAEVRRREPQPAPRVLPPVTVLVIDDHPEVRSVATRILGDAGCHILEAASASEAQQLCIEHDGAIDVAVLDVVLADGHGADLADQLCALRPQIRVILMSGYPAGALNSNGAPPRDLLPKPFTPSELRAAVARVLGPAPTGEPAAAPAARESDGRARVMVVDDDVDVRRAISRALRKAKFAVTDVAGASAATAALEAGAFDVIVSDVHMPDGDGLHLIRAVRRIDLDVPVVLMTGVPDVSTAAAAVEYGAFRYLTKPVDVVELADIVQRAARAHALARLRRKALTVSGAPAGAADRAGLEVRFEQAIDQLWMAFQPIFDARTQTLFGVEALLRSSEPSMPGPQHVLDAATQLGQLALLGRRVRALSARALSPGNQPMTLFVNLHPEDLGDIDLIARDAPLTELAPRVILEITERASLTSSPELVARLARLRTLGFRIAVDDIGAGYSGLTSFTELMPEIVKIDMSLVRNVHQSAVKQQTIRALCNLCHEVGCLVVGEGVETKDENDCIVDLGCDLVQGYLLGRPSRELP